jgi:hypothetical protein
VPVQGDDEDVRRLFEMFGFLPPAALALYFAIAFTGAGRGEEVTDRR